MAASTSSIATIQKMYVAYYGRPGDPSGIEFWASTLDIEIANGGSMSSIVSAFGTSKEYTDNYGSKSNTALVTGLYQQMFNHDPDAAGLKYYVDLLKAGTKSLGEIAVAIADGAQGSDKSALNNKVAAAQYYTDKVSATNAPYGNSELSDAKAMVSAVNADATSVISSQSKTDSLIAALTNTGSGSGTGNTDTDGAVGQAFSLTTKIDIIKGTDGDDIFVGDAGTTSAADQITGGGGTDLIKLYGTTTTPEFTGVENIYFNGIGSVNVSGLTTIKDVEVDASGSNTVTINNSQTLTLDSITPTSTTTVAGNTVSDVVISVDDFGNSTGANTLALTSTAITAVTLNAINNNSSITALTDAGGLLATLTVTGDKGIAVGTAALANLATINASANTGGVTISSVNATPTSLTFTGGTGNDSINMANTHTTKDTIDGGAGTDTLRVSDADTVDSTAETAKIKNFEIFNATAADATTYNLSLMASNNTLTGLIVSGAGATTTVSNLNSATANNVTITADATTVLTAKDFVSGGTADTATLNLVEQKTDATGVGTIVTFANADVLNVSSTSKTVVPTTTFAAGNSLTLTATDAEKVVITGSEMFTLTTTAGTVPTEVDASAMTNAVTIDTDASAIVSLLVKGTAKNDAIDIDNAATQTSTVYLGGGDDTIVVDGGSTSSHTFVYTATALNSGDINAGDESTITLTGAAAGDKVVINLSSALEGLLKNGNVNLGSTAADVNLHATTLSATSNIAATQTANNMVVQFDLNGDGKYDSNNDASITIVGTGTDDTLVYNASTDTMTFTVV